MKKAALLLGVIMSGILSCSVLSDVQIIGTKTIPESTRLPNSTIMASITPPSPTIEVIAMDTPTKSATMTIHPTPTIKPNILKKLSSGRYIVYTREEPGNKYYKYIVSETGKEEGKIADEGVPYLSPNQKFIAYSFYNKIGIFDIEQGEMVDLPIGEDCFPGNTELSWSPDSNELAVTCSTKIIIVSRTDGNKIGEISHDITPLSPLEYMSLKWSPDGEWMAYFILTGNQGGAIQGPFVTNTSCITNSEGCDKKTKLLPNVIDELIEWTPSNHLAVLDWRKKYIRIFNVDSLSLIQTVPIPDSINFVGSFSWSNVEEWIAVGSDTGLFVMSIKTGETKLISKLCYSVNFWYVVP